MITKFIFTDGEEKQFTFMHIGECVDFCEKHKDEIDYIYKWDDEAEDWSNENNWELIYIKDDEEGNSFEDFISSLWNI